MIDRDNTLARIWVIYFFLTLFGSVLNNIVNVFGLPNLFTIFRTFSLMLLLLFSVKNSALRGRPASITLILAILWITFYLSIATFQGKVAMGFYYLRLYLEPAIVLFLARYCFPKFDFDFKRAINLIGLLAVSVAFFTMVAYYLRLPQLDYFHGTSERNGYWFLGGAFIYRAGFPIGGPNQLGLFFSVLMIMNLIFPNSKRGVQLFYIAIFTFGLILTFSKSALLAVVVFIGIYYFTPNKAPRMILRVSIISLVLIIGLIQVDKVLFDGFLTKYVERFASNDDTSTSGHYDSLVEAVDNFDEYYFMGYEKGTVGPRAKQFVDDYKNAESSFFIALYDMGLFLSIVYASFLSSLMLNGVMKKKSLIFMISVAVPYTFLPMLHNLEITAIVFLVFTLIDKEQLSLKG